MVLLFVFAMRRLQPPPKPDNSIEAFKASKANVLNSLPIDSNDIVMIGTSLTESFPTELIGAKNRGIGFSTSMDILNRMPRKAKRIFLEVGINDILEGVPVDTVFCNIKQMVGGNTIAFTVPLVDKSYRSDYPALNEKISRLNDSIRTLRVPIIELKFDSSMTYDGLHPNKKGYEYWLKLIKQKI